MPAPTVGVMVEMLRGRGRRHLIRARPLVLALVTVGLAWRAGQMVSAGGGPARTVLSVGLALVVTGLALRNPKAALPVLVGWLILLGATRRIVSGSTGTIGSDPLLLVGPAGLGLLTVASWRAMPTGGTRLGRVVALLGALVIIAVVNPIQGGVLVGLAGLLFFLVPLLGFWIGRAVEEVQFRLVLDVIAWMSLAGALYGLVQTFVGFPIWDERWVASNPGYLALDVNGVTRGFGTMSSFAEYGLLLAFGIVVWVLAPPARARGPIRWVAVATAGVALLYCGSRGPIVTLLFALGVAVAVRRGWGQGRALAAAAVFLVLAPWLLARVAPEQRESGERGELIARQLDGLGSPLDRQRSTLPGHVDSTYEAIKEATRRPLGAGPGAASQAASKFGDGDSGAENDVSKAGVALGIPGLALYGYVALWFMTTGFRTAQRTKSTVDVVAIALIAAGSLQWLNGGLYAVAPLIWLAFGWLDGTGALDPSRDHAAGPENTHRAPVTPAR